MNNCNEICNDNYYRYVGWEQASNNDTLTGLKYLFNPENIKNVSNKITQILQGLDPKGREIVVTDKNICGIMSSLLNDTQPSHIGDIHSRYTILDKESRNDVRDINDRTIEIITRYIINEYGMVQANQNFNIWNSVYGDFNKEGLRSHPEIKIRKKHPQYMAFNMNY